MAKMSPLERVRAEHGSKEELVEKVLDFLEVPEDEDPLDFEHRIATLKNKKLLRLWDYHKLVQDEFGGREEMVDRIVEARFPGGNEDYRRKLLSFNLPRQVGLAREHGLV